MNKKICYISTISSTIKSFFLYQLNYLADNGFDVSVICSPDKELQEFLGEKIRYIPIKIERGVKICSLKKSIADIVTVFKYEKFDLVQYSTPNAAFCAAIAAKMAGIKIRNYHLMGFRYLGFSGITKYIFKALERFTCQLSTNVECITESNIKLGIEEKIFKSDKVNMVWNGSTGGVNLNRFDYTKREQWRKEIRNKLNYDAKDFVFGFVGRITRDKGINEILSAFEKINCNGKLLFIGAKEGINTLDKRLYEYSQQNPKIKFCDPVIDIEKYYAAIDILLLPSYREGFGMVIAEAAAVGTPAIVSDIPGPVDVIEDGKTAFKVKVRNYEDLEKKMQYVYDNPLVVKEMSGKCVEFVKSKFDADVLCEKILERKNQLLKNTLEE